MSANSSFFQSVNYASFHEDGISERRALSLKSTDRVLCLTGSGARALELALDDPAEVVAIDWNPAQSHLLELKIAVVRRLDYRDSLKFMGLLPSNDRESTFETLRKDLTPDAVGFWDQKKDAIRNGFFFEGSWEKFLNRISGFARLTRGKLIDRLINADDVEQQSEIWREYWDNGWWNLFLKLTTNRPFVKFVLREPGLSFVPREVSMAGFLRQRFEQASQSFLFRESPWMWALMKGRIDVGGPLPEHLQEKNFDRLKSSVDSIVVKTISLEDCLQSNEPPFDKVFDAFSLSDFMSYCDEETYTRIWNALIVNSNSNARYCERNFLVKYDLPDSIASKLVRDEELMQSLNVEDRSVVYSFLVARLVTPKYLPSADGN
jgi:S-adenosylmethionine-diacylglycerol 3-amino-3-carboxypropyl transferase